jgi:hypothetical protein
MRVEFWILVVLRRWLRSGNWRCQYPAPAGLFSGYFLSELRPRPGRYTWMQAVGCHSRFACMGTNKSALNLRLAWWDVPRQIGAFWYLCGMIGIERRYKVLYYAGC